jgi:hypothetical protein
MSIKNLSLLFIVFAFALTSCKEEKAAEVAPIAEVAPPATYETKLNDILAQMRGNEKWMTDLKKKATEQNKSIDTVMINDAKWMLSEDSLKSLAAPADTTAVK